MNPKENKILPLLEHQLTVGKTQNQKKQTNMITKSTIDEDKTKDDTIKNQKHGSLPQKNGYRRLYHKHRHCPN